MTELTSLKNIGAQSASWLRSVGIVNADDLYKIDAVEAYLRTKAAYPDRVSWNLLYALQGAILDLHWNDLPQDMKVTLRQAAE